MGLFHYIPMFVAAYSKLLPTLQYDDLQNVFTKINSTTGYSPCGKLLKFIVGLSQQA